MPLFYIMVTCGDSNPAIVSICNCTDHISEVGKKDVTHIAEMFLEKENEFHPHGRNTDLFFFDGASNVQRAGQILCQTFPRVCCFHCGEHILSLFFSDL